MHQDGNAIAAELEEIFAVEMTTEMRTCQSCGERHPIGAHRLYRGAGLVLRCPGCGDMAAAIVMAPGERRVSLFGTWGVEPAST